MKKHHICHQWLGDGKRLVKPISRGPLSPLSPLIYLHTKYIQRCIWYVFSVMMFIIGKGDKLLLPKVVVSRLFRVPTGRVTGLEKIVSMVGNSQSIRHRLNWGRVVTW